MIKAGQDRLNDRNAPEHWMTCESMIITLPQLAE